MPRDMHGDLVAEFEGQRVDLAFLFAGFFDAGTLRFWSGLGQLTVAGNVYTGAGNLISISRVEETVEQRGISGTFQLSGVPTAIIATALTEPYQGRRAKCWIAAFRNGVAIGEPYLLHDAFMDVMEIEKGGGTAIIRMNVETRKRKRRDAHYTHEDQQQRYAGDQYLSRVNELIDREIVLKA